MADIYNTATHQRRRSANTTEFIGVDPDWILTPPEVDALDAANVPAKYRNWTGSVVEEVDQATKDAIDLAELQAAQEATASQLDQTGDIMRAFMLVVLDRINVLEADHSRPGFTAAQLRTAIKNKLGD